MRGIAAITPVMLVTRKKVIPVVSIATFIGQPMVPCDVNRNPANSVV